MSKMKLSKLQRHEYLLFLREESACLNEIEGAREFLLQEGHDREKVYEKFRLSHKCCYHKKATYIHMLNGNRDKAIKTFKKWRVFMNDMLWECMENHKNDDKPTSLTIFDEDRESTCSLVDLKAIDTIAKNMKETDEYFCRDLNL